MTSFELRKFFLEFFKKKGHKVVPSFSLLPSDTSVLFTTAGMQQFKEYFLGKKFPFGTKVVSCQKCFRTSDIEEVGDKDHLTFLEMLGNFSFGDYFKKEAIELAHEFIIKKVGLEIDYVSVFAGDKEVPEDKESERIWQDLGIPKEKIKKFGREDNFWGPTGKEGPCGPTTEIYVNGVEIWNLVFNEYYQDKNKKLSPLKQKGVDTGMGLERLAMVYQQKKSVFETDLFEPIIKEIQNTYLSDKQDCLSADKAKLSEQSKRIIADHIKSSVFLISEGISPSNIEQGYVLRRILRRAIRYGKLMNLSKFFLIPLAKKVIEIYKDVYPMLSLKRVDTLTVIQDEEEKFEKTLEKGLKELNKLIAIGGIEKIKGGAELKAANRVDSQKAFYIYQTFGFPLEMIQEELARRALFVDEKEFQQEFKRHQEISRAGVEKKFGGIGEKASSEATKLHTATHLLHAALYQVLGKHVKQMGSDITGGRLRFDFSFSRKMTEEEVKRVEDLVNQKIKEKLVVKKEEMILQKALNSKTLAFFKEKYPKIVTVYTIFNPKTSQIFSKEICAGPHVSKISELGKFKIIKEESSGAGVRRIRAILE